MIRKLKLGKDKKGSIIDIAFLLVAILGVAIFILIVGYVFPQITSKIKGSDIGTNANSVVALDTSDNVVGRFDAIFLTIFVGIVISVLITSFFIDSSPILIPIYIIAMAILVIFAVAAEHIYEAFAGADTFSAVAATHPITGYIMAHLVMVAIGVGVLSMILIFAKRGGGGQYGGY